MYICLFLRAHGLHVQSRVQGIKVDAKCIVTQKNLHFYCYAIYTS